MTTGDRLSTLKDCLFTLVRSFNAALDRLDTLTNRNEDLFKVHQELISQNERTFKLAREDFFRRLIEAEVNGEAQKNQQSKERRTKFGSDVVR